MWRWLPGHDCVTQLSPRRITGRNSKTADSCSSFIFIAEWENNTKALNQINHLAPAFFFGAILQSPWSREILYWRRHQQKQLLHLNESHPPKLRAFIYFAPRIHRNAAPVKKQIAHVLNGHIKDAHLVPGWLQIPCMCRLRWKSSPNRSFRGRQQKRCHPSVHPVGTLSTKRVGEAKVKPKKHRESSHGKLIRIRRLLFPYSPEMTEPASFYIEVVWAHITLTTIWISNILGTFQQKP